MDNKKVAFLDIDQTLYNGYLFYEWAKYLEEKDLVSLLDIIKMDEQFVLYKIGHYDYLEAAQKISECLASMLNGKEINTILEATTEFIKNVDARFFSYTKPLIEKLGNFGYVRVLVTNEPDFLAEVVKENLKVEDALGLDIKIKEGRFVKRLENDLSTKHAKERIVLDYCKKSGVDLANVVALGDSEADIEMLRICGKGYMIKTSNKIAKAIEGTSITLCEREKVLGTIISQIEK